MSGFFMNDIEDFDEFWSIRQNHGLFAVYAALERRAWRQDKPKHVHDHQYRVTLWRNQLIQNIRKLALQIDLPDSTLRDRLRKLETMEAIRIDEPVPGLKIITILWAYNYGDHGDRTPCIYRAPSVVDLQADRDHTEYVSPQDMVNQYSNNDLQLSYTEDSRLKDSENRNRLVSRESTQDRNVTDETRNMDDLDSPSEADINAQVIEICELAPGLTPEQVLAFVATRRLS